jgi:hypothetical protein
LLEDDGAGQGSETPVGAAPPVADRPDYRDQVGQYVVAGGDVVDGGG